MTKFTSKATRAACYLCVLFLFFCSHFGNAQSEVFIELEKSGDQVGWDYDDHGNSAGISLDSLPGNEIVLNLKEPQPAGTRVWISGTIKGLGDAAPPIILNIAFHGNGQVFSTRMQVPYVKVMGWSSQYVSYHRYPDFAFDQVRISLMKNQPVYLDKILLTSDQEYIPQGTGRHLDTVQAILPPAWAFGVLYGGYTNQQESLQRINRLVSEGYPIDAYWIDSWFWDYAREGEGPGGYIDFVGDTEAFPEMGKMWEEMKSLNVKGGIWVWDAIQETGNEAVYQDFLKKGYFSDTYINTNGWHNEVENTPTGNIDFENQQAVTYWKSKLKPFFDAGLDFLKLDRSSEIPFMKAAFEATQEMGQETAGRGFIFSHLHTLSDPRFKLYPTKWTGDAMIAWDQPDFPNLGMYAMGAYAQNVQMVADPKLLAYEIPFLAHDAGGYNFFGRDELSDELYTRWTQFSAFAPVMTVFSTSDNPTGNMPFNFGEVAQESFRYYSRLRLQLFPYIYSAAQQVHHSNQRLTWGDGVHTSQFHMGDNLLIAPVTKKYALEKEIFLPEGTWYDFYDPTITYHGGQTIRYSAPLHKLPIMVKEGAIIPQRAYARSVMLGSNDTLKLSVYPLNGTAEDVFFEDDLISNEYLNGGYSTIKWAVTGKSQIVSSFKILPREGKYKGMGTQRQYLLEFMNQPEPDQVILNGQPIKFNYNADNRTIEISVSDDFQTQQTILIK